MTFKLLIPVFTDTLPLKASEVATKLDNLTVANTYIDSLVEGAPVSIDTDGTAIVSTGLIAGDRCIGLIVEGALANASANYNSLANKQITYVAGSALAETDVVVGGLTYTPGQLLYPGVSGNKGKLTNDNTGVTDGAVARVKVGRASGSTAAITIILL